MRQQHDSPTTEEIATMGEPRSEEDRTNVDGIHDDRVGEDRIGEDRADAERFEANGVESDRAEHESDQLASDQAEAGWTETDEPAVDETPAVQTRRHEAGTDTPAADVLFDEGDAARFRDRWHEVQSAFVDDPKRAVQDADVLVAELMQNLASAFSERKRLLEDKWREGTDAETEDLRLALRGYRSFLDQLLAH